MPESARIWLAFIVFIALAVIGALYLTGCTTAQLAEYQKGVDSRSIEGYAKDGRGGIKYTVKYR